MAPERSELVLAADVPALELNVLVLQGLHVEANRRNRVHCLVHLELVKDGCLARCIKTEEEDANIATEAAEAVVNVAKKGSHCSFL